MIKSFPLFFRRDLRKQQYKFQYFKIMKKIVYALLLFGYLGGAQTDLETAPLEKILTMSKDVIEEVQSKSEIILGRKVASTLNYQPKSMVFNFESANSNSSNVGIKILIFSIGRKWNKSITNNITYTYTYPDLNPMGEGEEAPDIFKYQLSSTIINALKEIEELDDEDKERLNEFSVKITFGIEKETNGGGEYELVPFTISGGKKWNKKATHTVTVTFKKYVPEELR